MQTDEKSGVYMQYMSIFEEVFLQDRPEMDVLK